jgi:PKD repeat protein
MKKTYFTLLALTLTFAGFSQLQQPIAEGGGEAPTWNQGFKAPGDSCGVYFNNYVGLNKTSNVFFEALRAGNVAEFNTYGGRSQHYNTPQPIEISGIQFYAFETNPLLDSIMAITILHDYTSVNDSVGVELARDTVYVTHQTFTPVLPDIEVNSIFDTPVTVTNDYMVTVYTPTDDSLKIIVSDASSNDGASEGISYLVYNNPNYTGHGYYNNFTFYGLLYDLDYLINPRIQYDLHDEFILDDDSICPGVVSGACVTYSQMPIYSDHQYNINSGSATDHILWLWGDGFQNTNLLNACHTYNNAGDYTIQLNDTLIRNDFFNNTCVAKTSQNIHIIDDPVPAFSASTGGSIIDFTSTSSNYDSLFWDMGDMTTYSDSITLSHDFDSLGTFDVWLFAYNECGVDSIMVQVTTDDVGFDTEDLNFSIYPNPAQNNVSIDGLIEGSRIELINLLGEVVSASTAQSSKEIINVNSLSNGTYFVRVATNEAQITKKLVVRH